MSSPDDVFVNCPFDADYSHLFDALIFTIHACGFRPRCAREMDDASESRIEKLYAIIGECGYGVHDLSRTELDHAHGLPRFNMPLELGIFLGAKRFGDADQRQKRCLVLDVEPYRYQKFISDLAGADIRDHGGDIARAMRRTRDWLATVSHRKLPGAVVIAAAHEQFLAAKPAAAAVLGLNEPEMAYPDYERLVVAWLADAAAIPGGSGRKRGIE